MTKSVLVTGIHGGQATTAAATQYAYVGQAPMTLDTVEANRQVIYRQVGTFSDIYARIPTNATTTGSTVTFRKNAVDGAMVLSIGSGATGEFVEATPHTVTIASGDKVDYKIVSGSTGAVTLTMLSVVFAPTTTTDTSTRIVANSGIVTGASSTSFNFQTPQVGGGWTLTEANVQFKWKTAGTIQNLARYNTAIRATTTTFRTRKNAANGGMSLTISGTAPLWFEDTSGSDTIAADDLTNYAITTGTGTTTDTGLTTAIDLYNTNGDSILVLGNGNAEAATFVKNTTNYIILAGYLTAASVTSTNETNTQLKARVGSGDGTVTFSNLSVNVAASSVSTGLNATVTLRKNAADTSVVVSCPGGSAGWFHDTTDTATVTATTDELNYKVINPSTAGGTHSLIMSEVAIYMNITSAGVNITKSLTETVTISDGLARLAGKIRTDTETITVSSTVVRLSTKNRSLTDTITISSTPVRVRGKIRSLTETVAATSTVARLASKIRPLTETITISSTLARIKGAIKALTSTVAIADSTAIQKGKVRTLTETVTISSTVARIANKIRTSTSTVTISSTPTRLASKFRTLTETVTISSTVLRFRGIVRTLTETVSVSSSVARLAAKIRTLTETVTISSTVARIAGKIRTLTSTVTVSDSVARTVARAVARALTETVSIASTVARLSAKTRTLGDTLTVASTPTKQSAKIRSISETVSISSTVARIKGVVRTLTETVSISDSLGRIAGKIRTLAQIITVSDSLSFTKSGVQSIVRTLTETVSLSSTVARLSAKTRTLSETTSLTDSLSRIAGKSRALPSQTVTIGTGIAARTRGIVRTASDTLTSSQTLARLAKKIRSVTSTVTILDQVTRQGPTKEPPKPPQPTQSILAQEIRHPIPLNVKSLQRFLLETVHIRDQVVIEVRHVSKAIKIARVKRVARILDLVKLVDDTYNRSR